MTPIQLKCFLAVSNSLKFSIAADNLYISQSTLSKQIKSLETELDTQLFNRTTRSITMTQAGRDLYPYAQRLMEGFEKMQDSISEYLKKGKKRISIASIPLMNQYGITELVTSYGQQNLDNRIEVNEYNSVEIIHCINTNQIDAGILYSEMIDAVDQYCFYPLIEDELCVVVNQNHYLAYRNDLTLKELHNESIMLITGIEPSLYKFAIAQCHAAGFDPILPNINVWLDTIKTYVQQGLRIALIMRKVAEYFNDSSLRIIELEEHPKLTLSIVLNSNSPCRGMQEFLQYATAFYAKK